MEQAVITRGGEVQAADQAGAPRQVGPEAEGGQDDRQPEEGGGAVASRAEAVDGAPPGEPEEEGTFGGAGVAGGGGPSSDTQYTVSDMTTTRRIQQLEQPIDRIKRNLLALGPLHPGSLTRQYSVCGKAGCRCKDRP